MPRTCLPQPAGAKLRLSKAQWRPASPRAAWGHGSGLRMESLLAGRVAGSPWAGEQREMGTRRRRVPRTVVGEPLQLAAGALGRAGPATPLTPS